jgi:hypothetical protein
MSAGFMSLAVLALSGIVVVLLAVLFYLLIRRRSSQSVTVHSSIQHMKSIGQLSVFKVITKEIVTESDHTWGDFGAKYLSWVISSKKMAMIFEFEIDFRYDLRRSDFEITGQAKDSYIIKMPPCFYEAHIRDIRFYDEQRSRFLPWLLPDLLNAFLSGGFSEANKNKLVDAAKSHAEKQAVDLINNLQSEVQNSAKATLQSISKAFGVQNVNFEFLPQGKINVSVGIPGKLAA